MYIENVNQNDYGSSYCLATCVLVIARYYGNSDLTMQDMKDANVVEESGYVNDRNYYTTISGPKSIDYSKITSEIDGSNPVVISMGSPYGGHYVVADSYNSADKDGITVMDPWDGTHKTLAESMFTGYDLSGYYTCRDKE